MPVSDDKILEKIIEISERSARMEVEQQVMKVALLKISDMDEVQNRLLDEHIKGVATANARLDNEIIMRTALEVRQEMLANKVEKLEEPRKFLSNLKVIVLYVAAIGGAALTIYKWFKS